MAYRLWPVGIVFEDAGREVHGWPSFVATCTVNKYPFQADTTYRLWQKNGRWHISVEEPGGRVLVHVRGDYDDCYAPPDNAMMLWGWNIRHLSSYSEARFRLFVTPAYSKRRHWTRSKHKGATAKTKRLVETVLMCASRLRHNEWGLPTEMWYEILGFIPTRLGRALPV